MAYWRMQLHPGEPSDALSRTVTMLAAHFIGLDFGYVPGLTPADEDVGDLLRESPAPVSEGQRSYRAFATEMKEGDRVLIMVHNFSFALCRVAGGYNYVREIPEELRIWFRHYRRVDDVRYYGDFVKDAHSWERIPMANAIGPLHDQNGAAFRLIQRWLDAAR